MKTLIDLLPRQDNEVRILRERADHVAHPAIEASEKTDIDAYVCFRLGSDRYGLPFQHSKEVMHHLLPTKLPQAPEFIAGIINRRGSLLAVLDLKRLFHIQPPEYPQDTYILIATGNKMTIGILADSIEGSCSYDPSHLDTPLPSEGIRKPEYIAGLHSEGCTALLNINAILLDIQAQVRGIL